MMSNNINTKLMMEACDRLGYSYSPIPKNRNDFFDAYVISDKLTGKSFVCSAWSLYPTQTHWHFSLMKYKDMCSRFLSQQGFVTISGQFFSSYNSNNLFEEISKYIQESLQYPIVIKPNDRSLNKGVSLIHNDEELMCYLNSNEREFPDLLVQQYIRDAKEYRIFIHKGQIKYLYEKTEGNFLKEPGSIEKYKKDNFQSIFTEFASVLSKKLNAPLIGADVFVKNDEVIVIELNANPALRVISEHYNDKEYAIDIWTQILKGYFR